MKENLTSVTNNKYVSLSDLKVGFLGFFFFFVDVW